MTKEEFAEKLNGRQYGNELPNKLDKEAKENGLVVVFGASDDLCEIGGACNEEVPCYGGGEIIVCKDGSCENYEYVSDLEDTELENKFLASRIAGNTFNALRCMEDGYGWTYETKIPHATFEILRGKEKECRGIVFELSSLK